MANRNKYDFCLIILNYSSFLSQILIRLMRNRVSREYKSLDQKKRSDGSDEEEKMVFTHTSTKPLLPQIQTPSIQSKVAKSGLKEPISESKVSRRNYSNSFDVGEPQGLDLSTQSMRKLINLDMTPENTRYLHKIPQQQQNLDQAKESQRYSRLIQRRRKYYKQMDELHKRRNKTQMQEYTGDQEQQNFVKRQKTTNRTSKLSRSENFISENYEHASFQDLWRTVPRELSNRNEENLRLFAYRCHKMNSLLRKLQYVTVVQLLKNCLVSIYEKNEIIYSKEKAATSSFIILWGKLSIIDTKTRTESIYEMGETIHQNYLLEYRRYELKTVNQTAVAIKNTGLLQLTHKTLVLIKAQLMQISLRSDLMNLQSQFRKNYLTKLNLRATLRQRHRRSVSTNEN